MDSFITFKTVITASVWEMVMSCAFSPQLMLPLKTQEDLDQAVTTLGISSGANGLLKIQLKTPKNNPVRAQVMKPVL